MTAYATAKATFRIATEHNAERRMQELPRRMTRDKLSDVKRAVEAYLAQTSPVAGRRITIPASQAPRHGYVERKVAELDVLWRAERLGLVTTELQQDTNVSQGAFLDPVAKTFKVYENNRLASLCRRTLKAYGRDCAPWPTATCTAR